MAEDDKKAKTVYFPSIPPKAPLSTQAYSKSVQDAPYRALIGVVVDARHPERHAESPRCRVRRQTGLTNRWRLPESLYSDLLGSSQAIKSINMPFNQSLVKLITGTYPTCNNALLSCYDFASTNTKNWSLIAKNQASAKSATAKEEDEKKKDVD